MNIPKNMPFTRLHPNDRIIYDQLKAMVDAYDSDDGLGPIEVIVRAKAAIASAEGK